MKKSIKQTLPAILVLIGLAFASCNSGKQESPKSDTKNDSTTVQNKTDNSVDDAVTLKSSSDGILLRYNPKLDETVSIKTTIDQVITVLGQKGTSNITMTMNMTATNKTDSLVTTQAQIKEMSVNSDVMGQKISFDSKHMEDVDPTIAGNFISLIDKTFEIVYDIYGNPVIVPEEYPKEQGVTAVFPKEMVHEGSQWTRDTESEISGMTAHSVATYTVKKINEKTTEIELSGNITADMVMGDMSGTMIIDNETGLPISATIEIPAKTTGDIPMTMNQTVTITSE